ncbi:heterokaryon incompatibility protein-domain-containing protein [Aspergillus pseudotamarii]|uniref:Heterokaryon incompatibility protein-domain-containing protein n=1 Tax=Aspergillus pseudotamarii TaxID=132259 RepID=A0A5N6T7Y3_ASPPS|nr:heterokaryon incompatibility protein-domain-containing protein [Aspergillus pseudotamarii]KAE8142309.1 heterokaryon incompatibility protein-domain-containing protein [Aspergillus pseudotamarii]
MNSFIYEPLDLGGPTFRLVRLCHGDGPDIDCELFQAWLYPEQSAISYEALSYTWGSTDIVESVRMNGKTLGITLNLYLILQHLRCRDEDRILWVDGICIDQGNDKERGHQVRHMGDIYKQAERVIFWLGQPTYETNVILDSLRQLQKESTRHPCRTWELSDPRWVELWSTVQPGLMDRYPDLQSRQRQGLEDLLNRPWFRRVWILQEVANARAGIVCCGQKSVSAHIFPLAPLFIHIIPHAQTQAVLDIMPGPSRAGTWWNMNRDLYTILRKFRASEARLPCDMVFALLGLSSDAHDTEMLRPDYVKSETEIIRDVVRFLFDDYIYYTQESYFPFLRNLLRNLELLNRLYLQHYMELANLKDLENVLKYRHFGISETDIADAARAAKTAVSNSPGVNVRMPEMATPSALKNLENILKVGHLGSAQKNIPFITHAGGAMRKASKESDESISDGEEEEQGSMDAICLWHHLKTLERLLHGHGYNTEITEDFILKIISVSYTKPGTISFLLKQRGNEINITNAVLIALVRPNRTTAETQAIQVQKQDNKIKLTEAVLRLVLSDKCYVLDLLHILLRQRGREIQITEEVLCAAVSNECYGLNFIKLLLQERAEEIHITEGVLDATASNSWSGSKIMEVLFEQKGNEINITDAMLIAAGRDVLQHQPGSEEIMKHYLKQHPSRNQITNKLIDSAGWTPRDVSRLLHHLTVRRSYRCGPRIVLEWE